MSVNFINKDPFDGANSKLNLAKETIDDATPCNPFEISKVPRQIQTQTSKASLEPSMEDDQCIFNQTRDILDEVKVSLDNSIQHVKNSLDASIRNLQDEEDK